MKISLEAEKDILRYLNAIVLNEAKGPLASFSLGLDYFLNGEYLEAIESCKKAIADNGGVYPDASYVLGNTYYEFGKYTEAIQSYKKAIQDNGGGFINVSFKLGLAYYKIGEYQKAIESFKKAIQDNGGTYPEASYNLGVAYYYNGQYLKAIESFKKAIQDNGGGYPDASYGLGLVYYKTIKYQLAITSFQKAINDSENHFYPMAHLYLSKTWLKVRQHKEARQHAFIALQQNDEATETLYHIAEHFSTVYTKNKYLQKAQYIEFYQFSTWKNIHSVNNETLKINVKNKKNAIANIEEQQLMEYCLINKTPLFNNTTVNKHRFLYLYFILRKKYAEAFYVLDDLMDITHCKPIDEYFRLHLTNFVGGSVTDYDMFLTQTFTNFELLNSDIATVKNAIANTIFLDEYLLDTKGLSSFTQLKEYLHQIDISVKEKELLSAIVNKTAYTIDISEFLGRSLLKKRLEQLPEEKSEHLRLFKHFKNSVEEFIQQSTISKEEIKIVIADIREYIHDEISYKRVLLTINQIKEKYTLNEVQEKFVAYILGASFLAYYIDVKEGNGINKSFNEMISELLTFHTEEGVIHLISIAVSLFASIQFYIAFVVGLLVKQAKSYLVNKDKDKWVDSLINEIVL